MAVNDVQQIFPTVEFLCDSTKGRPKSSFKNVKKMYHCPIETCKYFRNEFFFDKIKFLKQHFVKVHKPKSFPCSKCGKQFPLEATLNRHKLICGVTYRCYCKAEYQAYEALLTHVKRKHQGTTLKYKEMMECLKAHSTAQDFQKQFDNTVKVKAIIVEDYSKDKLVYVKRKEMKNASSKETQTGMKMCKILPNVSSQTQTSELGRKTVSLQTSVGCGIRRRRRSKIENKTSCSNNKNLISSATQTIPVKEDQFASRSQMNNNEKDSHHVVQTTSFQDISDNSNSWLQLIDANMMFIDDPNLGCVVEEGVCTIGTQTNSVDDDKSELPSTASNLIMCSDSETQTAFEDIFDSSYLDTYTQTCDSLFSDLDFVDIETQTSWSIFNDKISEDV